MRIEGRNPVREALRAGYGVHRILIAQGTDERGPLEEIAKLAADRGIQLSRVAREELDTGALTASHQGVIAEVADFRYTPWQDAITRARAAGWTPLLLALDGVTDPQNAGSLVRSASLLGAHAVVFPQRRSASLTASMIKASAGAVFHMPIDQVPNLERALADCKQSGLWVVGLDAGGTTDVSNCPVLSEPLALVVGAEGRGLSRLLRERADVLVRLPQQGRIESFNAAVAGALAMYEVARARSSFPPGTQLSGSMGDSEKDQV